MSLPPSFYDHFEDRLNLAVFDINEQDRMGRQSGFRQKFNAPDLTLRLAGHFQIINLEGHEITIGSMATDEQIAAEIAKIRELQGSKPVEEQNMSITGAAYLAGTIKDRINAAKAKVEQVSQNTDQALVKLNEAADKGDRIAKQIEAEAADLQAQLGQWSNE